MAIDAGSVRIGIDFDANTKQLEGVLKDLRQQVQGVGTTSPGALSDLSRLRNEQIRLQRELARNVRETQRNERQGYQAILEAQVRQIRNRERVAELEGVIAREQQQQARNANKLAAAYDNVVGKLQRVQGAAGSGFLGSVTTGLVGGIVGGVTSSATSALLDAFNPAAFAQQALNQAASFQDFQGLVGVLADGQQQVDSFTASVTELAKVNPLLGFKQARDGAAALATAGVELERVTSVLNDLSFIGAAGGAGVGTFATILGQVIGVGQLRTEEVNQVLESGGFNIRPALAQVLEVTQAELADLLSDSDLRISPDALLEAFSLEARNLQGLAQLSDQNISDQINRIQSGLAQLRTQAAQALTPLFVSGLDVFSDSVEDAVNRGGFERLAKQADDIAERLRQSPEIAEALGDIMVEVSELGLKSAVSLAEDLAEALEDNPDLVQDLANSFASAADVAGDLLAITKSIGLALQATLPLLSKVAEGYSNIAELVNNQQFLAATSIRERFTADRGFGEVIGAADRLRSEGGINAEVRFLEEFQRRYNEIGFFDNLFGRFDAGEIASEIEARIVADIRRNNAFSGRETFGPQLPASAGAASGASQSSSDFIQQKENEDKAERESKRAQSAIERVLERTSDFNRQLAENYEDLALEIARLEADIDSTEATQRIREAFGFGDNPFSDLVDAVIGIADALDRTQIDLARAERELRDGRTLGAMERQRAGLMQGLADARAGAMGAAMSGGGSSQFVGTIGSTGRSTGPHLDIRARDAQGRDIDPSRFVGMFQAGGRPLSNFPVTSPRGNRIHPVTGRPQFHRGIDYGIPAGTPLQFQGDVANVRRLLPSQSGGGGNAVILTLPGGETVSLLHLQSFGNIGQTVRQMMPTNNRAVQSSMSAASAGNTAQARAGMATRREFQAQQDELNQRASLFGAINQLTGNLGFLEEIADAAQGRRSALGDAQGILQDLDPNRTEAQRARERIDSQFEPLLQESRDRLASLLELQTKLETEGPELTLRLLNQTIAKARADGASPEIISELNRQRIRVTQGLDSLEGAIDKERAAAEKISDANEKAADLRLQQIREEAQRDFQGLRGQILTGAGEARLSRFGPLDREGLQQRATGRQLGVLADLDRQLQGLDDIADRAGASADEVARLRNALIQTANIELDGIADSLDPIREAALDSAVTGLGDAFLDFGRSLGQGEGFLSSFASAFGNFAQSILSSIASILAQQAALSIIGGLFGGGGGGIFGGADLSGTSTIGAGTLGFLARGTDPSLQIPNFARGNALTVGVGALAALQRERQEGTGQAYLAALNTDEMVLNPRQSASLRRAIANYRAMQDVRPNTGALPATAVQAMRPTTQVVNNFSEVIQVRSEDQIGRTRRQVNRQNRQRSQRSYDVER